MVLRLRHAKVLAPLLPMEMEQIAHDDDILQNCFAKLSKPLRNYCAAIASPPRTVILAYAYR
jgi:hypothetical protein